MSPSLMWPAPETHRPRRPRQACGSCPGAVNRGCYNTKPLKGLGAGVLKLVYDADKNACRVVYALKIGANVYVIDVFQKKSKTGRKTPRDVKSRIEARLKWARALEKGDRP